jgi:hypothetical protein
LGEKQIGFGGVLVFCNGASISLLDESIGYQAIENLLFTPIETFGLFLSTPVQKCIGWPEQKYISEAGKKARRTGGPWFRHQAWIGLSAGVSELAGRARRLL